MKWKIVAIIDWEMAGLFPFSYEYWYKDEKLGSANLYFTWYAAYKRRMKALLPAGGHHIHFMQALTLIHDSRYYASPNFQSIFSSKWRAASAVEENAPPNTTRWALKAGAIPPTRIPGDVNDALVQETLKAMGRS